MPMDDSPPYRLEIAGLDDVPPEEIAESTLTGRPWVGVTFECCGIYHRIYRNAAGTAYEGRCPGCLRVVSMRIGPGGTNSRFFNAK